MSNKKPRIYTERANALREKLGGRDYVLGLDLGVGSIGSAIVALDKDPFSGNTNLAEIVYSGVRVFPSSKGAAERRINRSQRNSLRHRRNRLVWVWKTLAEKGLMLPYSTEDVSDPATLRFSEVARTHNPYDLRFKGLSERLELDDLGYAIYHIANHRGSSSVMAEDSSKSKSESSKYSAAKELTKELSVGQMPFITVLVNNNKGLEKKVYRNTESDTNAIAPMPTRDLIENELNELLAKQQSFYPEILTDDYILAIKKAVLFENEMIVPEAGNCPYFPEERKLPYAAFINEERRLWETLNNVRFTVQTQLDDGSIVFSRKQMLDDEHRQKCFEVLNNGSDLSEKAFKKIMAPFVVDDIQLQGSRKKEQKIIGFRFKNLRNNQFFSSLDENTQTDIVYIWTNSVSPKKFTQAVVQKYGFEEETVINLIDDMPGVGNGKYAPCGMTAMKIIMEHIVKERLSFNEALVCAIEEGRLSDNTILRNLERLPYYGEALPASMQKLMGKAWHSAFADKWDSKGFSKPSTDKNEDRFGKIANPVVHQTLNELRHLINEMIDVMGKKPSVVKLETARDLKVGQEKRELIENENKSRAARNEKIVKEYLSGNAQNRGKLIKALRIWEDQGRICPYCVENDTISASDVIEGRADLDHIFPRDDIPGNPENNLIVCHKLCNEIKKKRIPYAAFSATKEWTSLLTKWESNDGFKSRMWRLSMTNEDYENWLKTNGMLSRFKTDNAYISLVARDYLSTLFSEKEVRKGTVSTVKGSETAILRKAWSLQDLTSELAAIHDPSVLEEMSSEKIRTDVRHHALDAITIAYSSRSAIQRINTMNADDADYGSIQDAMMVPNYYVLRSPYAVKENSQCMRNAVLEELLNHTYISRKIDHSKNGQLLNATKYSFISSEGNDLIRWTRKKVENLKPEETKKKSMEEKMKEAFIGYALPAWVKNEREKALVNGYISHNAKVYERFLENIPEAESELLEENESLVSSGKKAKKIDKKVIYMRALKKTGGKYYQIENGSVSKMFITRENGNGKPGSVFDTGANYCIDLYHDANGKLQGEVIRKVDIMNRCFVPEYTKKGFKLFQRLFSYDVMEVDLQQGKPVFGVKVPNDFIVNRTFVIPVTYTTTGDSNIHVFVDSLCKEKPTHVKSFYLSSSMKNYNPRIVKLSHMGLVEYVSPVLGDLK